MSAVRDGPVMNVMATARSEDGVTFAREAVALLRPTPRKPVTYLAWRESTAPRPKPEEQH